MTYDFHGAAAVPGPIAPKWWVNDVASYAARVHCASQDSLGMPAYGRDWFVQVGVGQVPAVGPHHGVSGDGEMGAFARSIGKHAEVAGQSATSEHFTYVKKYSSGGRTCRAKRVVWFDDARSLQGQDTLSLIATDCAESPSGHWAAKVPEPGRL